MNKEYKLINPGKPDQNDHDHDHDHDYAHAHGMNRNDWSIYKMFGNGRRSAWTERQIGEVNRAAAGKWEVAEFNDVGQILMSRDRTDELDLADLQTQLAELSGTNSSIVAELEQWRAATQCNNPAVFARVDRKRVKAEQARADASERYTEAQDSDGDGASGPSKVS